MREDLATLVIHDIKNSLALLEAELEQLNHRANAPVEAHKAHQRCIELKNRLVSFLTLYKHEHAGLKPNIAEIDLVEFLEDMVESSQSVGMSGKHGHTLKVQVDNARIRIAPEVRHKGIASFDEYLVDMAIESALNNAVRYAASRVDIWFEQDAERLAFFVLDDGPGLTSPGNTSSPPSTGVGLALCKVVAEVHGGGSAILSNALGGGALFMMELNPAR